MVLNEGFFEACGSGLLLVENVLNLSLIHVDISKVECVFTEHLLQKLTV